MWLRPADVDYCIEFVWRRPTALGISCYAQMGNTLRLLPHDRIDALCVVIGGRRAARLFVPRCRSNAIPSVYARVHCRLLPLARLVVLCRVFRSATKTARVWNSIIEILLLNIANLIVGSGFISSGIVQLLQRLTD